MRTPEQLAMVINSHDEYRDDITLSILIARIQSDASRSAARSERERAARVCEERCTGYEEVDEECRACARSIRRLPDANTDDAGEGEAT